MEVFACDFERRAHQHVRSHLRKFQVALKNDARETSQLAFLLYPEAYFANYHVIVSPGISKNPRMS